MAPHYELLRDDDRELVPPPSQLWLLFTLEIVIRDELGTYLLLTYPSYPHRTDSEATPDEGYWTPPFVGYPVPIPVDDACTSTSIVRRYLEYETERDAAREIELLAYHIGLRDAQIVDRGGFIEYKPSPRNPRVVNCYKIRRFGLERASERDRRNIADPEGWRGYAFLPLAEIESTVRVRPGPRGPEWWFLGKPLISNVRHLLESPERRDALRQSAIPVSRNDFRRDEEGILLCFDVAGYGTLATDGVVHRIGGPGPDVGEAEAFRFHIATSFTRFLLRVGISQVQLAGDGFVCAVPRRTLDGTLDDELRFVMRQYVQLLADIEDGGYTHEGFGSRLAVHFGPYRYGRIALAHQANVGFEGPTVIAVARLEAGLREHLRSMKADGHGVRHSMICSQRLFDSANRFFANAPCGMELLGERAIHVKEYEAPALLFSLNGLIEQVRERA